MVIRIKCVVVVVVVVVVTCNPGMQLRFKEFRQICPNTLCIPGPIFQQLDSRSVSAMLVLQSCFFADIGVREIFARAGGR